MNTRQRLFAAIDARHHIHLDSVMMRVAKIYEQMPGSLKGSTRHDANYYVGYPYLFLDAFDEVDASAIETLAVAGVLYLDHVCILDTIADRSGHVEAALPLLAVLLQERALAELRTIFAANSGFWALLQGLTSQHVGALLDEQQRHCHHIQAFEEGEFYRLATEKAGVSKAAHLAIAFLANDLRPDKVDALSRSQDHFNAAFQAYDDVKDWKEDLAHGVYTELLTLVLTDLGLDERQLKTEANPAQRIASHLYYGGFAEMLLESAANHCTQAVSCVSTLPLSGWKQIIGALQHQITSLHDDLHRTRVRTILSSRGLLRYNAEELLQHALRYLDEERAAGFQESTHSMGFLRSDGTHSGHELQAGNVFQRAIITDVLLDANETDRFDFRQSIAEECEHLLASRLKSVRGGWSYFPQLNNLPPDADDLGQVIQVMARAKHPKISIVDDDLHLLFQQGLHDDGSFETWIVDHHAQDALSCSMRTAIQSSWGSGPDVEVVANLGYSLLFYQSEQYHSRILKAAKYVSEQQNPDGLWYPTWYATPLYGTYVVLRFLSVAAPDSSSFLRAAQALIATQQRDGGFGINGSTPLETALALLSVPLLPLSVEEANGSIAKALRYLELTVQEDGTWNSTNFIQMDVCRARRGADDYQPQWLFYKSRTITTGYVAKALLAIESWHQGQAC